MVYLYSTNFVLFVHIYFYFALYFSCLNGCAGWWLCSRLLAWNWLPLNTYISVYARTKSCCNDRGSTTNYVSSSLRHCICLFCFCVKYSWKGTGVHSAPLAFRCHREIIATPWLCSLTNHKVTYQRRSPVITCVVSQEIEPDLSYNLELSRFCSTDTEFYTDLSKLFCCNM